MPEKDMGSKRLERTLSLLLRLILGTEIACTNQTNKQNLKNKKSANPGESG